MKRSATERRPERTIIDKQWCDHGRDDTGAVHCWRTTGGGLIYATGGLHEQSDRESRWSGRALREVVWGCFNLEQRDVSDMNTTQAVRLVGVQLGWGVRIQVEEGL